MGVKGLRLYTGWGEEGENDVCLFFVVMVVPTTPACLLAPDDHKKNPSTAHSSTHPVLGAELLGERGAHDGPPLVQGRVDVAQEGRAPTRRLAAAVVAHLLGRVGCAVG